MLAMFRHALSFNQPLSKWDVSRVTNMGEMFRYALFFNQDLSNWDVSHVTNMDRMFTDTRAFKHTLCGTAWVRSNASKVDMFTHSPGFISDTVRSTWICCLLFINWRIYFCFVRGTLLRRWILLHVHTRTFMHSSAFTRITEWHPQSPHVYVQTLLASLSVFSPQSRDELKLAVGSCKQVITADHASKKQKNQHFLWSMYSSGFSTNGWGKINRENVWWYEVFFWYLSVYSNCRIQMHARPPPHFDSLRLW